MKNWIETTRYLNMELWPKKEEQLRQRLEGPAALRSWFLIRRKREQPHSICTT